MRQNNPQSTNTHSRPPNLDQFTTPNLTNSPPPLNTNITTLPHRTSPRLHTSLDSLSSYNLSSPQLPSSSPLKSRPNHSPPALSSSTTLPLHSSSSTSKNLLSKGLEATTTETRQLVERTQQLQDEKEHLLLRQRELNQKHQSELSNKEALIALLQQQLESIEIQLASTKPHQQLSSQYSNTSSSQPPHPTQFSHKSPFLDPTSNLHQRPPHNQPLISTHEPGFNSPQLMARFHGIDEGDEHSSNSDQFQGHSQHYRSDQAGGQGIDNVSTEHHQTWKYETDEEGMNSNPSQEDD